MTETTGNYNNCVNNLASKHSTGQVISTVSTVKGHTHRLNTGWHWPVKWKLADICPMYTATGPTET